MLALSNATPALRMDDKEISNIKQKDHQDEDEGELRPMNQLLKSLYLERMQRLSQQSLVKTFYFRGFDVAIKETAGLAMGSHVWAGSKHLVDYISTHHTREGLAKKRIIELGAGCGLLGIAIKKSVGLDSHLVITEKQEMLPALRENLQLNQLKEDENLRIQELKWGEHSDGHHQTESFDYIVASDVVFNEALFKPLIHTIVALSGFNTTLLLAHSARHKSEAAFFKELSKYYIVTKLHRINVKVKKARHPNDKLGTSKDIVLFHMKRRRYSIVSLS